MAVQARARATNLWLDKHGNSKGPHHNATMVDAPLITTHWPGLLPWLVIVVIKNVQVAQMAR